VDVYVKTAGKRRDLEYEWYRILHEGRVTEAPPMLRDLRIESLVQDQSFTVVLARAYSRLMLLVGWMRSGRFDFNGRPIRNFVAWIGGPHDEAALRAVAALALRGGLDASIDKAVTEVEGDDFRVSLEMLKAIPSSELAARAAHAPPDSESQWGPNTDALKSDLADQLERARLPERDGPLVVVTGIVSPERLSEAGVWRALASTIETTYAQKKKRRGRSRGCSIRSWIPLLVFLMIFLIALVVTWLLRG
jgi:hypothetical protein